MYVRMHNLLYSRTHTQPATHYLLLFFLAGLRLVRRNRPEFHPASGLSFRSPSARRPSSPAPHIKTYSSKSTPARPSRDMSSRLAARPFLRAAAAATAAASRASRPYPPTPASLRLLLRGYHASGARPAAADLGGDGSHSDFAPRRRASPPPEATPPGNDDEGGSGAGGQESDQLGRVHAQIRSHVTSNPVMLYMKGTPSSPMCGFSAKVVQALQAEGTDFSSVNVLDYPHIRDGIKTYSEWPTIPQLYVGGEFVGGCDIVLGMHDSGELRELLGEATTAEATGGEGGEK